MNNEIDVKDLMAEVAVDRLSYAKNCKAGDEIGDKAFEQGVTAYKAYADMTKIDDAHDEELRRQELEKTKQEHDEENRKKERKKEYVVKGIEFVGGVVVAPAIAYVANKGLVKYIGTIEQMETFTSSAGRAIGRMFKFNR